MCFVYDALLFGEDFGVMIKCYCRFGFSLIIIWFEIVWCFVNNVVMNLWVGSFVLDGLVFGFWFLLNLLVVWVFVFGGSCLCLWLIVLPVGSLICMFWFDLFVCLVVWTRDKLVRNNYFSLVMWLVVMFVCDFALICLDWLVVFKLLRFL